MKIVGIDDDDDDDGNDGDDDDDDEVGNDGDGNDDEDDDDAIVEVSIVAIEGACLDDDVKFFCRSVFISYRIEGSLRRGGIVE